MREAARARKTPHGCAYISNKIRGTTHTTGPRRAFACAPRLLPFRQARSRGTRCDTCTPSGHDPRAARLCPACTSREAPQKGEGAELWYDSAWRVEHWNGTGEHGNALQWVQNAIKEFAKSAWGDMEVINAGIAPPKAHGIQWCGLRPLSGTGLRPLAAPGIR